MEAITEKGTVFNPIQQHLLMMFSHMNSEEQLKELKKALADYYFDQVEKEMAELEAKGIWSKEKCEEIAKEHLRTPYVY
jgi:predicted lipid-binding transport protein (Tim44 family)